MRFAYHIARYEGRAIRAIYERALPLIVRWPRRSAGSIAVHVVAFSSARDLPEQVASARSFLRYVGEPPSFTVASDGSHDARQRDLLRRVHPAVDVVDWDAYARVDLPERVLRYAAVNPMGKKLAVIASLPPEPVLYVDSDVLFFPGARDPAARNVLAARSSAYQPQGWSVGYDHSLLPDTGGEAVNAGFIVVASPLNWRSAFDLLPDQPRPDDVYLEQTLVHLAMRETGARPLPLARFPVHDRDQFLYREAHHPRRTVLRHYVSVTRHKFWLALARQSTLIPAEDRIPKYFADKPPAREPTPPR